MNKPAWVATAALLYLGILLCAFSIQGCSSKHSIEKAWVTTCGISQTLNDYGASAPYRLSCITKWQNVPNEE